ncbi:MAG: hypothetical protein JOZ69_00735, partial [Myxococcales bacterium]|nr:hypothetical protein [Myxococcales bacterium]
MTPSPANQDLPEWFNLNAFNATLQAFPEFAQLAGVDRVNNCQTARQAAAAYLKYSADFPGFDRDVIVPQSARRFQALEPDTSQIQPSASMDPPPIEKIANGTNAGLRPVVTIKGVRVMPDGSINENICTASFISRNWMATAGHCLEAEDPAHPTADISNSKDLFGGNGDVFDPNSPTLKLNGRQVPYFVTFYNPDGTPFVSPFALPGPRTLFRYQTIQYLNPSYKGFFGQRTFEDDFALLYISDADDNRLHADPSPPPGLEAPWLRIMETGLANPPGA